MKLRNKEFLIHIVDGGIIKGYDRYYKIEGNNVMYSDNKKSWKVSSITINDFLSFEGWEIVE